MPLAAAVFGRRPDREGIPAAGDREGRARLLWLGVVSMRGRVSSDREIAVPPDPEFRLVQAPALGRLLPVGAGTRELGSWLAPLLLIAIASVGGAILAGGLPAGPAGPVTVGLLAIAAALAAAGLSGRVGGRRVAVPALVGVGMCGAGLDLLADGSGYVIGYMAVAGLALRAPPRVAVLAGSPVVAAIAVEEALDSANPAATSLAVLSAFGFLFTISEFAVSSLGARHQAEALLVQEALANVAKHAGRGARVTVRLAWADAGVEVSVVDSGGDGVGPGLPPGGFGLTSMAERATLKGGRLRAEHSDDGFAVRLWLPAARTAVEPAR